MTEQLLDPVDINIIAWGAWPREILDDIETRYHDLHGQQLRIAWTEYYGGADFVRRIKAIPNGIPTIVIGDRELMINFAREGMLHPICSNTDVTKFLERYASWLRPFAVRLKGNLFGTPIRWGTTPILVDKELYRLGGDSRAVGKFFDEAKHIMLWNPRDYFLYSMAVISVSVNPVTPLQLTTEEFELIRKRLEIISKSESPILAGELDDFIERLKTDHFSLVTCAGEWVLDRLEMLEQLEPVKKRYEYIFPHDRGIGFFETAGILNTQEDTVVTGRTLQILCNRDVLAPFFFHLMDSKKKIIKHNNFFSNPVFVEDSNIPVSGPGYKKWPAENVLKICLKRDLPSDELYRPTFPLWKQTWRNFTKTLNVEHPVSQQKQDSNK